jgi:hypothetical protein
MRMVAHVQHRFMFSMGVLVAAAAWASPGCYSPVQHYCHGMAAHVHVQEWSQRLERRPLCPPSHITWPAHACWSPVMRLLMCLGGRARRLYVTLSAFLVAFSGWRGMHACGQPIPGLAALFRHYLSIARFVGSHTADSTVLELGPQRGACRAHACIGHCFASHRLWHLIVLQCFGPRLFCCRWRPEQVAAVQCHLSFWPRLCRC